MPAIYNSLPSDELLYILFILQAELLKRETLSVIDYNNDIAISKNRIEGVTKATQHKLIIKEKTSCNAFWNSILIPNLKLRYNTSPVHSLKEIDYLKQCFPNHIRQFNVYCKDKIVAGTTIFETKQVAHAQYIAANQDKNNLGSLDFLHAHLIQNTFANKRYFDFGTSNENDGKNINKGLQFYKEGFGARTIVQDFYSITTANYSKLNAVLV